jgi:hypothetical protein
MRIVYVTGPSITLCLKTCKTFANDSSRFVVTYGNSRKGLAQYINDEMYISSFMY